MIHVSYISTLANFLSIFDPFNTDAGTHYCRVSCSQMVFDFVERGELSEGAILFPLS